MDRPRPVPEFYRTGSMVFSVQASLKLQGHYRGSIGKSVGHRSEAYLASVPELSGCGLWHKGSSLEAHFAVTQYGNGWDQYFSIPYFLAVRSLASFCPLYRNSGKILSIPMVGTDFFRKCLWNGIEPVIEVCISVCYLVYNRFYYLLIAASLRKFTAIPA